MSWHIHNEFIKDNQGNLICTLFPGVTPFHAMLIKRTPDILSLLMEFRDVYESKRKMSKKLYDNLCSMNEENENYNFTWQIDQNGYIIDMNVGSICFFPEDDLTNCVLIKFVPEMFKVLQQGMPSFDSKNAKQKTFYEGICKMLKRLDEY